eukprot:tig00000093_g3623.t1
MKLDEPGEIFRAGVVAGVAGSVSVLVLVVLLAVCVVSRKLRRAKPPLRRFPQHYTILPPRYIERGPVETCDWLNTAVSVIAGEILKPKFVEDLRTRLHELCNRPDKPAAIGDITFRELEIGSVLPALKRVQLFRPEGDCGRILADVELEYTGNACVDVETSIYVDWPVPRAACMPVAVGLRNIRFEGKVRVEWATADDGGPGCGYVCFVGEPFIDFDITTSLGHVEKLEKFAAVGTFLRHKVRDEVRARLVYPSYVPIGRWPEDAAPIDPKGGPVATGASRASGSASPAGVGGGGGAGIAAALGGAHHPSSFHSTASSSHAGPSGPRVLPFAIPAAFALASPEQFEPPRTWSGGSGPRDRDRDRDRTPKKAAAAGSESPRLQPSAFRGNANAFPLSGSSTLVRRSLGGDKRG